MVAFDKSSPPPRSHAAGRGVASMTQRRGPRGRDRSAVRGAPLLQSKQRWKMKCPPPAAVKNQVPHLGDG